LEYDSPDLDWINLFHMLAGFVEILPMAEPSSELPNEIGKWSSQYFAWKFGQIASRFAFSDKRWREKPLDKLWVFKDYIYDRDQYDEDQAHELWSVLMVVASLLVGSRPGPVWEELREGYVRMWNVSFSASGTRLRDTMSVYET
jgi:hypothetical protein